MHKIAIITGGSSGIGLKATEKLMKSGIHVIIASRTLENINKAIVDLKKKTQRDNVEGMVLDLCDPTSIRCFVSDFKAKNIPLNILINNAGVTCTEKRITKFGTEETFTGNHLGHFLLTNLLLDKLKESAPSRVVILGSNMHDPKLGVGARVELPIEEYNFESRPYNPAIAYRFGKLCTIWFMLELNRRLEESNSGVIANALEPGFVPSTGLSREHSAAFRFMGSLLGKVFPAARTLDHAGSVVVDLALNEKIKRGGDYYMDYEPVLPSERARDQQQQRQMWEMSERLSGLKN